MENRACHEHAIRLLSGPAPGTINNLNLVKSVIHLFLRGLDIQYTRY